MPISIISRYLVILRVNSIQKLTGNFVNYIKGIAERITGNLIMEIGCSSKTPISFWHKGALFMIRSKHLRTLSGLAKRVFGQASLKANSVTVGRPAMQNFPSLLVGLLYDAQGNRFTPFHTDRRGKRYRYYVSREVVLQGATATPGSGALVTVTFITT